MQFEWNFIWLIDRPRCFAYLTGFSIEWFLAELWPFEKNPYFSVVLQCKLRLVIATPQKLLVQFLPNFTRMISIKPSFAYRRRFPVQWFLTKLWPFNDFCFKKFVSATSHILLMQFEWNFIGLIDRPWCFAYLRVFSIGWFLAEFWTLEKKHIFLLCYNVN